jgi:hypothetical protein
VLMTQTLRLGKNIRTVVDGQQRLRAIISFVNGDFTISRAHNRDLAGLVYAELPEDIQSEFLKYEIGVDILFDLEYEDILDIFARLNTYSVKLNQQELLNSQYLGYFKQTAYRLGFGHVRYWIDGHVISEKQATRMAEAELASDLLGTLLDGIQSKKAISIFYKKYDDEDNGDVAEAEAKFRHVMSVIATIYDADSLKVTNYSRIHLFHSLFTAVAHCIYGLDVDVPRSEINLQTAGRIRNKLDEISARYDAITAEVALPPDEEYRHFIDASRRATTDASSRRLRVVFICSQLANP